MAIRVGQAPEQRPPIVGQRHDAGHQPAACQIVRREAAPTPLVLQLVEGVLAIATIAIELAQRDDLGLRRRHQRAVLPQLPIGADLDKAELQLAILTGAIRQLDCSLQAPTQQDHPARPAPAHQPKRRLLALPAMAGIGPVTIRHRPLQRLLHLRRLSKT